MNTLSNFRRLALLAFGALTLVAAPAHAQDRKAIEQIIREFIVQNPEVVQEALMELERRQRENELAAVKMITTDPKSPLYQGEGHFVAGNPDGDVTLVEFFDYNCGFCKRGFADIQKIMDTDKKVRIVLKQFPVLSAGSRDAAVVALALKTQFDREKLWKFHSTLLAVRGSVGKEQALGVAKDLGADMKKLDIAMEDKAIQIALNETKSIADSLGVNGTPTYVVAEEVIVGARGYDALANRVANYRKCKKAEC